MLPRAVREQAERAEQAHLQSLGNTAPAAPVVEVKPPEPAPVAKSDPPEPPQPSAAIDSWELKYKVLNGKYTAEVPRMAAQIRDLQGQVRQQSETPPAANDTTDESLASVTERYGPEFAEAVNTIADAKTKRLRDELSSKVDRFEADSEVRSRNDFIRDLKNMVPTYQSVDQDPGFTAFLDEFDSLTGRQRREFFNEADGSNDAARVASFFDAYLRGKTPPPVPVVRAPQSVEHLISPDSSRSSESPPGKKVWTQGEIKHFYAEARRGAYTPEQYGRIELDIFAANREGRLIG